MHKGVIGAAIAVSAMLSLGMARVPPEKEKAIMDDPAGLIVSGGKPAFWHGGNCGVSRPETRVIEDAAAWDALWSEEFAKSAPDVDFKEHFAVAVFLGLRNTGGYSVEFLPPALESGEVTLGYRVLSPAPTGFVIQAFTQPYAIQLYKKTKLPFQVKDRT